MKKFLLTFYFLATYITVFAQYGNPLVFNQPYISSDNRSVILPADRIPSDFLGCTLGVTTEVDALKNLNRLGIRCNPGMAGASETLTINGDIECEGAKFTGVTFWFYNNIFWKIVFHSMKTDSKRLANTIRQKYSKFPCVNEGRYGYIRYVGSSTDLVHNESNLQYTIRGGSCIKFEE